MKKNYFVTFTIIMVLCLCSACKNENAEELYYSNIEINPDTTKGRKILANIPFNNSIADKSGNNLKIITHGNPKFTNDRFDKEENAVYFNGKNEYIEFDISKQDSISISFWFKSASGKSNFSSLFDYGENSVKTNIDGYSGATSFKVTTFYNNLEEINAGFLFKYNTWYHIYVSACKNSSVYVNGEKIGEIKKSAILNSNSTNLIFGKSINNTNEEICFHGIIDDINVYNFALTQSEINEIYGNYSTF